MYEDEYKQYLKAYAKTKGITEIQAEQHLVVKLYKAYLEERNQYTEDKQSMIDIVKEQEQ